MVELCEKRARGDPMLSGRNDRLGLDRNVDALNCKYSVDGRWFETPSKKPVQVLMKGSSVEGTLKKLIDLISVSEISDINRDDETAEIIMQAFDPSPSVGSVSPDLSFSSEITGDDGSFLLETCDSRPYGATCVYTQTSELGNTEAQPVSSELKPVSNSSQLGAGTALKTGECLVLYVRGISMGVGEEEFEQELYVGRFVCWKEGFQDRMPCIHKGEKSDSGKCVLDQLAKDHNHDLDTCIVSAKRIRPGANEGQVKLEPYVGLKFDSGNEAYQYYDTYAGNVGFRVHIGQLFPSKNDDSITSRRFVCSKE
ncbi:hypothetical protein NL676_029766 [Syzygium grande]|nr:hypothetical protein NL676_029766 [Syzygium grande]